ncbi:hypothetical protein Ade02nite_03210 [Paractinoplanes deccanensis]|uniref:Uncharacterized protein n=1 Tax=Paractinoplanes deccanensis TaxID=113561 RepID=A0ABQ3XVA4_9ACTN|nr:hypothetical protein [Actinoplanes deccanensis]GID71680.1 hypothetical protein Ade02nite_03210 [Actinoplanes deccanensis]
MTTPRLLVVAYAALLVLALGRGVPLASPVLLLVVLLALGELWLRALAAESMPALARLGLATVAGLVSLPFTAIGLHAAGVRIHEESIAAGLAGLLAAVAVVVLLRERAGRVAGDPRLARTAAAVAVPGLLTLVVGVAAVRVYDALPHPPEPGYTSLALNGWAGDVAGPVRIPAGGLMLPIRVSSAGEPEAVEPLRVRVGDRLVSARPLRVSADTTRAVEVYVPSPPDGCLHRIEVSLGATSTVLYGRGAETGRGGASGRGARAC